jgi:hypothetical protein
MDPVDRPEVACHFSRVSDHAGTVNLKTSRSAKPSLDNRQVSEDSSATSDDESTLRPGVVAISGARNDSMGPTPRRTDTLVVGDGTEQQPPNTDPNGNRYNLPVVVMADVALCGGAAPDVEQGGPLQAQAIDEEEYRQRIENEYRDRLLRQAAVDVSPGFVRADKEKDSHPEVGLCTMSIRTTWIAIILAILIVVTLAVGVPVALTGLPPPPPIIDAPNSTVEPTTVLSCEERCNMSSSWAKVEVQGPDLKRAIFLYLEGTFTRRRLRQYHSMLIWLFCLSVFEDPALSIYGPDINCWDVSLVTNMDRAFAYEPGDPLAPLFESFNEPLDCWNTSNV